MTVVLVFRSNEQATYIFYLSAAVFDTVINLLTEESINLLWSKLTWEVF